MVLQKERKKQSKCTGNSSQDVVKISKNMHIEKTTIAGLQILPPGLITKLFLTNSFFRKTILVIRLQNGYTGPPGKNSLDQHAKSMLVFQLGFKTFMIHPIFVLGQVNNI